MNVKEYLESIGIDTRFASVPENVTPTANYPQKGADGRQIHGRAIGRVVRCSHETFTAANQIVECNRR